LSYLSSDYTISCHSGEYMFIKIYAAIFIFVYPLGVPLLYFWLLYKARDRINPPVENAEEVRGIDQR
jgi:hypothetical protein